MRRWTHRAWWHSVAHTDNLTHLQHPKQARLILAFAFVLAGCGASPKPHQAAPQQPSQADRVKAVVRAWTTNLNAGNNAAEARLFSLPVLINTAPDLFDAAVGQCWCRTRTDIVQFHAGIPCSGFTIVRGKIAGRVRRAIRNAWALTEPTLAPSALARTPPRLAGYR